MVHSVRTPRGALAVLLAAAVSAALLAGCTGGSASEPSPVPSAAPDPTPASSASSSQSPRQVAAGGATAIVATYFAVLDELFSDPKSSPNKLYTVAVDAEASVELRSLVDFRRHAWRETGKTVLVKTTVTQITIPTSPTRAHPVTVAITACTDLAHQNVVNAKGKSVVVKNRPRYLISKLVVINLKNLDAPSWRVQSAPNQPAKSCGG